MRARRAEDGETIVESYTITGMAHGTPLAIAENEDAYGATSKFMIDAGIASSWHIAQFFGLTSQPLMRASAEAAHDRQSPGSQQPRMEQDRRAARRPAPNRHATDVSSAITRALSAIGLIK